MCSIPAARSSPPPSLGHRSQHAAQRGRRDLPAATCESLDIEHSQHTCAPQLVGQLLRQQPERLEHAGFHDADCGHASGHHRHRSDERRRRRRVLVHVHRNGISPADLLPDVRHPAAGPDTLAFGPALGHADATRHLHGDDHREQRASGTTPASRSASPLSPLAPIRRRCRHGLWPCWPCCSAPPRRGPAARLGLEPSDRGKPCPAPMAS